jgi:hypothetical protein
MRPYLIPLYAQFAKRKPTNLLYKIKSNYVETALEPITTFWMEIRKNIDRSHHERICRNGWTLLLCKRHRPYDDLRLHILNNVADNKLYSCSSPGLYALIAIPVSTIIVLVATEFVGKFGAATFTQLVSGALSTFLPVGPPVVWMIIPAWCMGGIIIDILPSH